MKLWGWKLHQIWLKLKVADNFWREGWVSIHSSPITFLILLNQTYRSTRHLPHRPPIDYADDWRGITSTYSPVPLCNQLTDSFVARSTLLLQANETDWRMRLELHFFEGTRTLTISWMQRSWSESKCTSPFCVVKGCLLLPNTLNECLYVKLRSYYVDSQLCWCKLLQVIKKFHTISATFTLQFSPISKRVKFLYTTYYGDTFFVPSGIFPLDRNYTYLELIASSRQITRNIKGETLWDDLSYLATLAIYLLNFPVEIWYCSA